MASYTNATRFTGMASGIDTDSYVKQLMSAASTRYNTYQRNLQKLQWKQTAYRDTATKINTFQSKWLDLTSSTSLRRQSTFTSKYTSSATKADGTAVNNVAISGIKGTGSHTVEVKSTATAAKLYSSSSVSGKLDTSSAATAFKFTYDGIEKEITVNQGVTGDEAAQSIKAQLEREGITGLDVSVDAATKQMTISSSVAGHAMKVASTDTTEKKTDMYSVNYDGNTTKFELEKDSNGNYTVIYGSKSLQTNTSDAAAALDQALADHYGKVKTIAEDGTESEVRAVTASADENENVTVSAATSQKYGTKTTTPEGGMGVTNDTSYTITYGSGDDAPKYTFELSKGDDDKYSLKLDGSDDVTKYDTKEEAVAALNTALKEWRTVQNQDANGDPDGDPQAAVQVSVGEDGSLQAQFASVTERAVLDEGHTSDVSKSELVRNISTTGFDPIKSDSKITKDSYMSSVIGNFSGALSVTVNGKTTSITADTTIDDFLNRVNADSDVKMSYNSVSGSFSIETKETGATQQITFDDEGAKRVFSALGFDTSDNAVGKKGTDASLIVDGVETVSSSNKLQFDEFTADITYAAKDTALTLSTSKDTNAIFDMLKSFVDEYNELIGGITTSTTENRVKGPKGYYEPLTDDEKEAMKETDIEKWEKSAKTGLLYGDQILKGFLSSARNGIYSASATNKDGGNIGIYNIGITTSNNMNKSGQLVLDESKLKAAIEDDPDAVMNIVNNVAEKLNDVVKNYTGSYGRISTKAGAEGDVTEYNNSLYREINSIKDKMSSEYTRLQSKESRYYEMFANMENYISKNNTTLDSIYGFMGW